MFKAIRNLFSQSSATTHARRAGVRHFQIESLEDRKLMSATPASEGRHIDKIGAYDGSKGMFYLDGSIDPSKDGSKFQFGEAGKKYIPLSGDWDGDGIDTVGLYDQSTGIVFLANTNGTKDADLTFVFGKPGNNYQPVVGDWDGDGKDTIALIDQTSKAVYYRDGHDTGFASRVEQLRDPLNITGDFDGDGKDEILQGGGPAIIYGFERTRQIYGDFRGVGHDSERIVGEGNIAFLPDDLKVRIFRGPKYMPNSEDNGTTGATSSADASSPIVFIVGDWDGPGADARTSHKAAEPVSDTVSSADSQTESELSSLQLT